MDQNKIAIEDVFYVSFTWSALIRRIDNFVSNRQFLCRIDYFCVKLTIFLSYRYFLAYWQFLSHIDNFCLESTIFVSYRQFCVKSRRMSKWLYFQVNKCRIRYFPISLQGSFFSCLLWPISGYLNRTCFPETKIVL